MTSQLNVETIVDKAGSGGTNVKIGNTSTYVSENSSTTQNTVQGICKCWTKHENDASLYDSYNITSGTDNGTGDYTFTITNAFNAIHWSGQSTNVTSGNYILRIASVGTTSVQVKSMSDSTSAHDDDGCIGIHGDLA